MTWKTATTGVYSMAKTAKSTSLQKYLLTVMNEEGHFIRAEACECESKAVEKAKGYDDRDVTLIPCDSFVGFNQSS